MSYVEHANGGHFPVTADSEPIHKFLNQLLIIGDGDIGGLIYHLKAMSLKVQKSSLHFRLSDTPMISICLLMENLRVKGSYETATLFYGGQ